MESHPWPDMDFQERMNARKDAAAWKRHAANAVSWPARVSYRIRAVGKPWDASAAEVAAILECSAQRVRKLLADGRIVGARKRKGQWKIPITRDGRPDITLGKRGPAMGSDGGHADDLPF